MKSKLRVVAGHGGRDTGALAGGLVERDLNIASVLAFNDVAMREFYPHDVTVQVIGPDDPRDGDATLLAKIADANEGGPDQLLIEVHHNVGGAGTGAQLWYSQRARSKTLDETWLVLPHLARELGFLIGDAIPQLDSSRSRFGKLGILDDVECTAVLVEARNVAQVTDPLHWTYSVGTALARAMGAYFGWPRVEQPAAQTAIAGVAPQDPRALVAFMRQACPTAAVDVDELVRTYVAVCKDAGIRADVALAHVIHETGRLTFTGTVKPDWNNFAGVGVTSAAAEQKFDTMLAGVKGHVYHLRWYDAPDHGGLADCCYPVDPRHNVLGADGRHASSAHLLRDLGGRWAPSGDYGLRVAIVLDELNRFVAAWAPTADSGDRLERAKKIAAEAAAQIAAL
jgi:hypothetical protein